MFIPPTAIIPTEKLTAYLLVLRPKNDKSQFLVRAGFSALNPTALDHAIRTLIAENEGRIGKMNMARSTALSANYAGRMVYYG